MMFIFFFYYLRYILYFFREAVNIEILLFLFLILLIGIMKCYNLEFIKFFIIE